ncbi:MAG: protein-disulfide reductase DsbD domain-containing protein [Bacteroidia bacterium]
MKFKPVVLLLVLFSPLFFSAQTFNPVKWDAFYQELPNNNEGMLIITAHIDKNWHIYSQRPTNDGPIPTSFTFTPAGDYVIIGKTDEENAKEEFVKAFDAKLYTFETTAIFKQKLKRTNLKAFVTKLKLEYMTCNDMQCLPPKTVELTVNVPAKK